MQIVAIMILRGDTQPLRAGSNNGHSSLDRLHHHVAQTARSHMTSLTTDRCRLYRKQFPADRSPGQTGHLAHLVGLIRHPEVEFADTQ